MSSFLNNIGQVQLAYLHLLFSINIRSAEGWNIPDYVVDLMKVLKKREEENIVKIDILKKYWISVIYNELTPFTGNVIDIHKNGKFGFIKHENNSYYFKTDSVVSNSKIRKNDRVKFCIVESFDRIKSKTSTEAVYITVDNTKKNS
jgi:transcription termination factor Rho